MEEGQNGEEWGRFLMVWSPDLLSQTHVNGYLLMAMSIRRVYGRV